MAATVHSFGQGYGHLGRVHVNMLATNAAQHRLSACDLPFLLRLMLLTAEHLRARYQGVHYGRAQNVRGRGATVTETR